MKGTQLKKAAIYESDFEVSFMLASTNETNGEQKKNCIALVEKWKIAGEQFREQANFIAKSKSLIYS